MTEHYPQNLITVEGFTDPAGPVAYNLALGKSRADAVRSFLVEQGNMGGDRIRTVSYGEAEDRQVNPGAWGPGAIGMTNRRVTLVIETSGNEWDISTPDDEPPAELSVEETPLMESSPEPSTDERGTAFAARRQRGNVPGGERHRSSASPIPTG